MTRLHRPARRTFAALAVAATALLGASVASAAPAAAAATLLDAVTGASIVQTEVADGASDVTVHIDFDVDNSSGTVHAGDLFWVDFDPLLAPLPGTFAVMDGGQTVATVTIADDGVGGVPRATFVLTDYVESRLAATGFAEWDVSFADTGLAAGPHTATFTVASGTFQDTVTLRDQYTPADHPTHAPVKNGQFTDAGQQRIGWWIYGGWPTASADDFAIVDTAPSDADATALWAFDCSRVEPGLIRDSDYVWVWPEHYLSGEGSLTEDFDPATAAGGVHDTYLETTMGGKPNVTVTCTPDEVTATFTDVPLGYVPYLNLYSEVTDTRAGGALAFTNDATVTQSGSDGDDPVVTPVTRSVTQTYRGSGSGPTAPVAPTVTQARCSSPGQRTAPVVALPADVNGVTYTADIPAPAAGDTVTVTATLAAGYTWQATLPAGWSVTDAGHATYAVVLAAPDCGSADAANPPAPPHDPDSTQPSATARPTAADPPPAAPAGSGPRKAVTLGATGADPLPVLALAVLLLGLGVAAALVATSRRSRR